MTVNTSGFQWKEGRQKIGQMFSVSALYSGVFSRKNTIKASRRILQETSPQTLKEQMRIILFYVRGVIINGAYLNAEKVVKGVIPEVVLGNVAHQHICPDISEVVPFDIEVEIEKVELAHKELGELDEKWEKSRVSTGSLEDLIHAVNINCSPHLFEALDPRGFERRSEAKRKLLSLHDFLEKEQKERREKLEKEAQDKKTQEDLDKEKELHKEELRKLEKVLKEFEKAAGDIVDDMDAQKAKVNKTIDDAEVKAKDASSTGHDDNTSEAALILVKQNGRRQLREIGVSFQSVQENAQQEVTDAKRRLTEYQTKSGVTVASPAPASHVSGARKVEVMEPLSPGWLLPKLASAGIFNPHIGTFSQHYYK